MTGGGAPRSIDLSGQSVLVTGAGRGLGRGIAQTLARWGARVGATDIDATAAAETLRLVKDGGGDGWTARLDVSDEGEVSQAVGACWTALGGIDLLVNNAGILSVSPVVELDPKVWRRTLEVNATGVFLCSQAVARRMIESRRPGSIVSIASIGGKRGTPTVSHYNASKFAVIGFTQAMAREVAAHDILVNAVCPGVVDTQMITDMARGVGVDPSVWIDVQAIKKSQTPEDIAFAIAFLHRSRAMTGQAINVDGGAIFH